MTRRSVRLILIALTLAAAALVSAPLASGRIYYVEGCKGYFLPLSWFDNTDGWGAIAGAPCKVSNRGSAADPAPLGHAANYTLLPPSGASLTEVSLTYDLFQGYGWAGGLAAPGRWIMGGPGCAGGVCGGPGRWQTGLSDVPSLHIRIACEAPPCGQGGDPQAHMFASDVVVGINDPTTPSIANVHGDLWTDAWQAGRRRITFDASDNTGIERARVSFDGRVGAELGGVCYVGATECDPWDRGTSIDVHTSDGVADGRHALTLQVFDKAGNVAQVNRTVFIDNTAPAAPENVRVVGGREWRSVNTFDIAWSNPSQAGRAPIVGAAYRLCPVNSNNGICEEHVVSGQDMTSIKGLKLPRAGEWTLRIRLLDAAGNSRDEMAARPLTVGWDEDAPEIALPPLSPEDPTRVLIQASDRTSPLTRGDLELRRQGTNTWQTMRGEPMDGGFEARIADEELPKGRYDMRVRVADSADNERSTDRLNTGEPAQVTLPVRTIVHLVAGRKGRRTCSGHGQSRRCRTRLIARPGVRYRSRATLLGRLTLPRRQPVAGTDIEIWEQVELQGAPWRRLSTVRTSRTGRFRFRAPAGPARALRFRYPGTRLIRPQNAEVALRVRASTTLRVSDHRVVNGEYVTFRGRVRGRPFPASGKLVELQAYTGGGWRTFAQPRASAKTGRWQYRYRFQATRGRVRYRFRARVRQEADYPFHTGTSRRVRVTVVGL